MVWVHHIEGLWGCAYTPPPQVNSHRAKAIPPGGSQPQGLGTQHCLLPKARLLSIPRVNHFFSGCRPPLPLFPRIAQFSLSGFSL